MTMTKECSEALALLFSDDFITKLLTGELWKLVSDWRRYGQGYGDGHLLSCSGQMANDLFCASLCITVHLRVYGRTKTRNVGQCPT